MEKDGDKAKENNGEWLSGKKRPNKGHSRSHGRSIHPNEHTGIRKQVIPANQLKNPTWDRETRQWIEGNDLPVEKNESKNPFSGVSEIKGDNATNTQMHRVVSPNKITSWRKYSINKKQSIQGGRRTHKHKRKNKHTRRRRVQRRRA